MNKPNERKNMKVKIKAKVKAKAAAVKAKCKGIKAKVKAKCKKCAVIGVLTTGLTPVLLICGCMDTNPASRANDNRVGDIEPSVKVNIGDGACSNVVNVTMPIKFGDGLIASADSAGSKETQTATPTMDVKPDVDVDVPITKGAAGQAADALGSLIGGAISGATQGGSSSTCPNAGGSCSDGSCELK